MELTVQNVSKRYGKTHALEGFTYSFTPGIYGILGANGAGKSTLFGLLTDTVRRESGEILCDGTDILKLGRAYRARVGYLPQSQGYYPQMSAREFLYYMGGLKGLPRRALREETDRLLEAVDLTDAANRKLGQFSGGMRQRILLAQALLGSPELLILDEPTAGVDPRERIRIRGIIASLAREKIVLLATHVVTDVECVARTVLLMNGGRLLRAGTPEELIASLRGKAAEKVCPPEEIAAWQTRYGFGSLFQRQEGQVLRLIGDTLPPEFTPVEDGLSLEEVYLYYCTDEVRGGAAGAEPPTNGTRKGVSP